MPDQPLHYTIDKHGEVNVMMLHEPAINTEFAPILKTEMLRLIASGAKKIVVNFDQVTSIDSSGLGALTFSKRQLEETGGELVLCCMNNRVRTLFRIAALERAFDICESLDDALVSE